MIGNQKNDAEKEAGCLCCPPDKYHVKCPVHREQALAILWKTRPACAAWFVLQERKSARRGNIDEH